MSLSLLHVIHFHKYCIEKYVNIHSNSLQSMQKAPGPNVFTEEQSKENSCFSGSSSNGPDMLNISQSLSANTSLYMLYAKLTFVLRMYHA